MSRKLSQRGKTALRQVQKDIRKQLRGAETAYTFDLGTFISTGRANDVPEARVSALPLNQPIPEGFCSTAGCIAGGVALNAGFRPVVMQSKGHFFSQETRQYEMRDFKWINDSYVKQVNGSKMYIEKAAVTVIGPQFAKELHKLFIPGTDKADNIDNPYWKGIRDPFGNPRGAITAIERFIRMHS
jgi:hypothetical protein